MKAGETMKYLNINSKVQKWIIWMLCMILLFNTAGISVAAEEMGELVLEDSAGDYIEAEEMFPEEIVPESETSDMMTPEELLPESDVESAEVQTTTDPEVTEDTLTEEVLDESNKMREEFLQTVDEIAKLLYGDQLAARAFIVETECAEKYHSLSEVDKENLKLLIENAKNQYEQLALEQIDNEVEEAREKIEWIEAAITEPDMIDLSGNRITQAAYDEMLAAMKKELEEPSATNIPIENWRRSKDILEIQDLEKQPQTGYQGWTWSDIQGKLELPATQDESEIWDASRLNNGKVVHQGVNEMEPLKKNQLTVLNNKMYDSTTWLNKFCPYQYNGRVALFRYQGEINIPENENRDGHIYTLKPVTDNDRIYINDDLYVFVYPRGTQLTDENFMDYLVFWTGTHSKNGSLKHFHGRKGALAVRDKTHPLAIVTDGWSTAAVPNNAGIIGDQKDASNFVIDVFADDNAEIGGMYRLKLERQEREKAKILFRKVSEENPEQGLEGAQFVLTKKDGSGSTTNPSDHDGYVRFNVLPGEYILQETKAPEGYHLEAEKRWYVKVESNLSWNIYTDPGYRQPLEKNSKNEYIIKNQWLCNFGFDKKSMKGQPLQGAEFLLYKEEEKKTEYKATSDGAGRVDFSNIPAGRYLMKEIAAPAGYEISDSIWAVELSKDQPAKIYLKDDESKTEVSIIENYTGQEIIDKSIEFDKSVKVQDFEKRTYAITLTADSKVQAGDEKVPVQAERIVDVIDHRFTLAQGERERLIQKGAEIAENNEKGETTISWNNISVKPQDGKTHGWTENIIIQAKEDFMGGNVIPTNGDGSGIYLKKTIFAAFPKPTVHVKLLSVQGEELETTVFVQDMIEAVTFPQKLQEKIKVQKIENKGTFSIPEKNRFTEKDMENLLNGKEVRKDYDYQDGDVTGRFVYHFEKTEPVTGGKVENHKEETPGQNAEKYILTVKYEAIPKGDRNMSGYKEPVGEEQRDVTAEGYYHVHVVAGSVTVTKRIRTKDIQFMHGDPVFVFELKSKNHILHKTVRFHQGNISSAEFTELQVTFENLPKGEYVLREEETIRYELESMEVSGGSEKPCEVSGNNRFVIGGTDGRNFEKLNGLATVTNKKINKKNDSSTGVIENTFHVDENGNVIIKGEHHDKKK